MSEPGRAVPADPPDPLTARAIYDGRELLGWTVQHERGWLAYRANESLIGLFKNRMEAVAAVTRGIARM